MNILEKWRGVYAFKSAIGLEMDTQLNSGIRSCYIKKEGATVEIVESKTFSTLDEVAGYTKINNNPPLSIHLVGKGILLKSIENVEVNKSELSEQEIQLLLPSFNKEEFYTSQFKGKDKIWVVFVKILLLDNFLTTLNEAKIHPVQLFIGPFLLSNIIKQINVYNQIYTFDGHKIETDEEGNWIFYDYDVGNYQNPFNIKVGNKTIEHSHITSYASAFSTLLVDYLPDYSIQLEPILFRLSEAKEKLKFNVNSKLVLGFLFILLLISTIFFNHYYQENQQLEGNISSQNISEKQLEDMTRQTTALEQKLKDIGWNGGISKAWLLDQIGASLNNHPSISLTKLAINPAPTKKIGQQSGVDLDNRNLISIAGYVYSLDGLNDWIRHLNQTKWVENVRITKFGKIEQKLNEENKNIFEAEIKFRHDF
jgi:Tfp pilus assembly protein PilN